MSWRLLSALYRTNYNDKRRPSRTFIGVGLIHRQWPLVTVDVQSLHHFYNAWLLPDEN